MIVPVLADNRRLIQAAFDLLTCVLGLRSDEHLIQNILPLVYKLINEFNRLDIAHRQLFLMKSRTSAYSPRLLSLYSPSFLLPTFLLQLLRSDSIFLLGWNRVESTFIIIVRTAVYQVAVLKRRLGPVFYLEPS